MSRTTVTLITQLGLNETTRRFPREAFAILEQSACTPATSLECLLALAELANELGRRTETTQPGEAILWSRDAAVYAAFCLAQLPPGQNNSSIWHAARDVHNRALVRCLRLAGSHRPALLSTWPATLAKAGIRVSTPVADWTALGFDSLQITNERAAVDWQVEGQSAELGVPLIAHRRLVDRELTVWKPYGPGDAVFAATAVIKPAQVLAGWRQQPVELVLHDPLDEPALNLNGYAVPLAHDLIAPLLVRLSQKPMQNYQYRGLTDPLLYATQAGVYALDAYQPGKIPVVCVQGIWSSPKVWAPMLRVLRDDPELRAAYQFWVVLYPSGYPIPLAGLLLRQSLRDIRHRFDPHEMDAALDQMVVLGKSTGGQLTRLLVQASGESLWNAIFTRPITQVSMTSELRTQLIKTFFFEPEPYIRRVIFVATGHRGSKLGAHPGVRLGIALIRRNDPFRTVWNELELSNGQNLFQPHFRGRALSSADGLEAKNPMLLAVDSQPIASHVIYHSIIANIHPNITSKSVNDGFVDYESAHLAGAASERIITASHLCEADRELIDEVRRILHVHLTERLASNLSFQSLQ